MILRLKRDAETQASTPGMLTVATEAGERFWFTIEQPWRDNQKGVSCVPMGLYELVPYLSPTHGATWCLHNPPLGIYAGFGPRAAPPGGRDFCELHSANWARQLEGCIALGIEGRPLYDPSTGHCMPAVEKSCDAIQELVLFLGRLSHGHTLSIA